MMRIRVFWMVAGLLLVLGAAGPAQAKNMHGKFGFGFQRTLLGAQGFSFNYWATPRLSAGVLAGLGFSLDADDDSSTTLLGSIGFKYVLVSTRYANLSAGLAADLGWANRIRYHALDDSGNPAYEDVKDASGKTSQVAVIHQVKSPTQWGIVLPIEVEYFFSDAFSINLATGFSFTMTPDLPDDAPADTQAAILRQDGLGTVSLANQKGIALGAGSLFGHAGFSFYF